MTGLGFTDRTLTDDEIEQIARDFLAGLPLDQKRVLVLIPDGTRTAPIPHMFRLLHRLLSGRVAALDFLIALGTHQPMNEAQINKLVGVQPDEWATTFKDVRIFNHDW